MPERNTPTRPDDHTLAVLGLSVFFKIQSLLEEQPEHYLSNIETLTNAGIDLLQSTLEKDRTQ